MAKLNNYNGSVQLMAGITQKGGGDFALIEAGAVQTREDGTRLDSELQEIIEAANTQADWNQTDSTKADYIKNKPNLSNIGGSASLIEATTFDGLGNGTNRGDIGVVTTSISGSYSSKTAYCWDGSKWVALDGNYNADNVYFDTDFTFTKEIGTVSIPSGGKIVVDAAGKNLKEFFAGIFAKEEYPAIPTTSASITSSNIGAKEVGTNIEVQYAFSTTANNYAWNQPHGVTWSNYSATFNGETKNAASGTFAQIQVTDSTNLSITGSVEQSAGAIPKTNLGKDYPEAQIQPKSWTGLTKGTLTGYRAWFYGYKTNAAIANPTEISSDQVRQLTSGTTIPATVSWTGNYQQMYFLIPRTADNKPRKKIVSVKDNQNGNPAGTILGPVTIYVKGANGYVASGNDITTVNTANGWAYDMYYLALGNASAHVSTWKIEQANV